VAQDAQLLLKVGLDLSTFRNQLATLGQAAAGYNLPIKIKFDRIAVQNELNALGVNIKRRTYKLEVATNIKAETENAKVLAKALAELGKAGQQIRGVAGRAATGAEASTVDAAKFQAMVNRATKPALEALYQGMAKAKIPMGEVGGRTVDELKKSIISGIPGLTQDIASGMTKGLEGLKESGRKGAKFVIDSFKDAAGIASPSKVFKQLGQFSAEGLEDGFLEGLRDFKGKAVSEIRKIVALMRMELATLGGAASSAVAVAGGGVRGAGRGGTQYMSPIGPLPHGSREPWAYNQGAYRHEPYMAQPGQFRGAGIQSMVSRYPFAPMPGVRATTELPSMFGMARPALPAAGMSSAAGMRQAELFAREAAARARSAERNAAVMRESVIASRVSGQVPLGRGGFPQLPSGAGGALALRGVGGGGGNGGTGGGGGFGGFGGLGGSMGGLNLPGSGLIRELGAEFAFATKQVLLFGQAYKLLGFAQDFPAQVGQAVAQLQNFNNTLKAISPTSQEVVASNQLIVDLVERYNIPLQSARDGFTKLYASMQPAGFSGDQVRGLFTGISKAAATFGMSADKVDRVNYAFAQMASKGQVMSEELKGQLGDVLPGAMAIFAQAAGFKGPEAITKFSEALEDGRYKGTAMMELLNNVSVVLNEKFSAGAEGAAKTFQGAINNMQTSIKGLYESFEPIATAFLNGVVSPMMAGIKVVTDGLNAFFSGTQTKTAGGFALAQALEQLRPSFEGIRQNATQIAEVLGQFAKAALGVAQVLLQIAGNPVVGYFAKVYLNVLVLTTAIQLLNLRALIPMIANLIRSAAALIGFAVQCARAGQSAQAMGLMAQTAGLTLRTFFASTGVGLVVVGIGLLIERFMTMNQALADTRAKALGAAQAIRAMSATEARQAGFQAARDVKLLQQLSQQEQVGGVFGRKFLTPNKEQQAALQRAGVTTQTIYNKKQGYGVTQGARIEDLAGAIQARQGILREAQFRERQVKFEEQQATKPLSFAEIKGGGGESGAKEAAKGGADKAAKEAARLAEEIARQAMAASDALFSERQRLLILQQSNPIAKAFAQYTSQELVIQRELNQALKDAKGEKEKADLRETARLKQSANALELEQEMKRAREDALAPIEDLLKSQREQLRYEKDVKDLLQQGMLPERAKQVAEVRKLVRTQLESLDLSIKNARAAITEAEARGASADQIERLKKALEDLEKARGGIEGNGKEAEAGVPPSKEAKSPLDYIKEGAASAQEELAKLTNWGYQAVEAGKAIGSAFGTAFKDLISGSASAQEALASMMQSIADHFLDMAAQIIAQQITMMIYGIILKALGVMGGVASGLSGAGALTPGAGATASLPTSYAGVTGGTAGLGSIGAGGGFGSFSMFGFANGGIVTGPTLGLVGEGKYNEAIVPLPDGRSIPVQMQGESIRDKMGSDMSGAGASPMLSMSFQTTTINGVEYVDRAQLEAAMAETRRISVREGATRGATIALDKLANSPSSRRRVGLR
jgi:tape measure domain-containing protein